MSLVVICPYCGARGHVRDDAAGRGVTCPTCRRSFPCPDGADRRVSSPSLNAAEWLSGISLSLTLAAGMTFLAPLVGWLAVPLVGVGLGLAIFALIVSFRLRLSQRWPLASLIASGLLTMLLLSLGMVASARVRQALTQGRVERYNR